jgi:uncharacterized sulfatase
MRFSFFVAFLVLTAPLFAADDAKRVATPPTPPKPNVLLVIADDLNCDLGCYGHKLVRSPNLDKLAAKGVRFDRAYVQYPVCNPSRTSFLTGLRPDTTKVLDNNVHFRTTMPDVVTLPQLFRANGYHTASLGKVFHRGLSPAEEKAEMDDPKSWDKQFYGKASAATSKGDGRNLTGGKLKWCEWRAADCDDDDLPDGQITTAAIDAMTTTDKPWFLAVGYYRPHDPFVSPKKYFDAYPLDKLEVPRSPDGYTLPYPHTLPGGEFKAAFDRFTDADKREFLRSYYAGVSYVDAQVGRLTAALDRLKLWDNTIVVFVGDHGYELGTRNWWNKATLFERSCRAPFLVVAPGAKGNGKATAGLTEFTDLYPTLAELCHLTGTPKTLEGASFVSRLNDPAAAGKAAAFTVVKRGNANLGRSVRTDRYRYTEWDGGKKGAELYDHTADPGEWKNLAADATLKDVVAAHHKLLADSVKK